jgi:hypothetical protein
MAIKGFTAKMTDIEEVSDYHRTTISSFLSDKRWDDGPIRSAIKQISFQHIQLWKIPNPLYQRHRALMDNYVFMSFVVYERSW